MRQNSDYSNTSSNDVSYAFRGQQQQPPPPIAKLSPRTSSHRQQPQQQQTSAPTSQSFNRTAPSAQGYAPAQYGSSGRPPQPQYQQQQQQAPSRYSSDSPRVSGAQQQTRMSQFQAQSQVLPQPSQSGRRLSGGQSTDSERMRSLLGAQANAPSSSAVATGGFSFYPSQAVAASTVRFSSAPRRSYR